MHVCSVRVVNGSKLDFRGEMYLFRGQGMLSNSGAMSALDAHVVGTDLLYPSRAQVDVTLGWDKTCKKQNCPGAWGGSAPLEWGSQCSA